MTIIAGFRCVDGVLLAADTEITNVGGTGKTYESKFFTINESLGCSLAYTGDSDFAKELVGELQEATNGKGAVEALSSIKQIYRGFWQEHYSEAPKGEKSYAYILLTLREGKRVSLYMGRSRHFTKVRGYAALGVGQDQSEALFRPIYTPQMSTADATYMAIYALRQVKGFVQWCGGDTETKEIYDEWGGIITFPSQANREIEKNFEFFESQVRPLLLAFSNLLVNDVAFHELLKIFEKEVKQHRAKNLREHMKELKQRSKAIAEFNRS